MLDSRDPTNFVDHCRKLALRQPDHVAFTWLRDGEEVEQQLSFAELDARARMIAVHLEERGLKVGDRALLLYPPGLEFISAFMGCLYAGIVAVPMNTPRHERSAAAVLGIARHAEGSIQLTDSSLIDESWMQLDAFGRVDSLATDGLDVADGGAWRERETPEEQLAFLQYTSGSTGAPKGVQVCHRNLVRDEQMIRAGFDTDSNTVFVNWLPLFHDMGLLGNILHPIFMGVQSVLMAPSAFVQQPIRWLRATQRFGGTVIGGPNFGYSLCAQRIQPSQLDGLDLSCVQLAYNGSEPIRAQTMEDFLEVFEPLGFRREVFYPCYGMAEASLYVSGGDSKRAFITLDVEREALQENRVVSATEGSDSMRLVECGWGQVDQRILIVDPDSHLVLADGQVGEIWLQGGNVAMGYRNLPPEAEDPFDGHLADGEGPFLRTGDLGFMRGPSLFVTGRLKDILIQHGQNYYPQDIERLASDSHQFLRADFNAAFTVDDGEEEQVVVVQEVHRSHSKALTEPGTAGDALRKQLIGAIRAAVSNAFGIHVREVLLVRHASIPKTSSGKIQRRKCKAMYLAGELQILQANSEVLPT